MKIPFLYAKSRIFAYKIKHDARKNAREKREKERRKERKKERKKERRKEKERKMNKVAKSGNLVSKSLFFFHVF